ncbi:MAG: hypothetical protein JNK32_04275 [Anaerolineales bacterium]|nr:hypothetical protein [Anaerolineales bacterium]
MVNTPGIVTTPTATSINVYRIPPNPLIVDLFQYAATPTPTATFLPFTPSPIPDINQPIMMATQQAQRMIESKHGAFERLIYEVERWTNIQKIKLDDTSEVHIMVTFISPELVQAVRLNNILARNEGVANIRTEMERALTQFSNREEMIFMVNISAVNINGGSVPPHRLEISVGDMILMNAENLEVQPRHEDQNLDQPIDLSLGSVFGYLYYPMAVIKSDQACTQVLDPIYNTKIVIQTDTLKIDSAISDPLTWTIPYKPLLETGMPISTPTFIAPEPAQIDRMQPSKDPPPGSLQPNWEAFARFLWGQITLEIY